VYRFFFNCRISQAEGQKKIRRYLMVGKRESRHTFYSTVPSPGGDVIPAQVELNGSRLGAFGMGVLARGVGSNKI
jgi:hypothetical protein